MNQVKTVLKRAIGLLFGMVSTITPHPKPLSKREGLKSRCALKVLSFGEDLGEASVMPG
jgi:hypothetical protein